jgi:predicted GTPase
VDLISSVFDKLPNFAKPLNFAMNEDDAKLRSQGGADAIKKTFLCMEGEIGVGKSSTNNQIIYLYCQAHGLDHTKNSFRFGRQVERVTKGCDYIEVGDLTLLDTPGTNDI